MPAESDESKSVEKLNQNLLIAIRNINVSKIAELLPRSGWPRRSDVLLGVF